MPIAELPSGKIIVANLLTNVTFVTKILSPCRSGVKISPKQSNCAASVTIFDAPIELSLSYTFQLPTKWIPKSFVISDLLATSGQHLTLSRFCWNGTFYKLAWQMRLFTGFEEFCFYVDICYLKCWTFVVIFPTFAQESRPSSRRFPRLDCNLWSREA